MLNLGMAVNDRDENPRVTVGTCSQRRYPGPFIEVRHDASAMGQAAREVLDRLDL